jgi:DNA repair exonuclease SbcCD ATPase subunit
VPRARKLAAVPDLERELDDLFGLPAGEFTAARNDLAKRLKAAGETEQAENVRGLAKPTVPAWAVNQLARAEKSKVRRLLEAGEKMRAAHERALSDRAGEDFRKATETERALVQELTDDARGLLEGAGNPASDQVVKRISETLRAASTDEEARELLEAGRLTKELEPAGFGALAGVPFSAQPRAPSSAAPARQDRARLQRELRELRKRAQEAQRDAVRATNDARHAQEAAAKATRDAEEKQEAAQELAQELEELEARAKR